MNRKINRIHALRLVYDDHTSSFNELLKHDKAISVHHRNIHCVAIQYIKEIIPFGFLDLLYGTTCYRKD